MKDFPVQILGKYYSYRTHVYVVITVGRMKRPSDGEWVLSVIYYRRNEKQLGFFTRELNDFISKFKNVDEEEIPDSETNEPF